MKITKIEQQKHHKNRCSVFIDGSFAFGISEYNLHIYHLQEGMELSNETLANIQETVLKQEAKDYALRLLDARAYTKKAMAEKLKNRGTNPEIIEETLEFLQSYHYIDDEEFARRYVQSASKQGKSGKRKLLYDLIAKGIEKEVAHAAIEQTEFEETDAIIPLLEKRLKGDYSFQNIMKAKRYILSRGFSTEAIDMALRRLKQNEEEWFDA